MDAFRRRDVQFGVTIGLTLTETATAVFLSFYDPGLPALIAAALALVALANWVFLAWIWRDRK